MTDSTHTLSARIKDLEERLAKIRKMGGEEAVARQHAAGKLTARERVALLFDKRADGSLAFDELMVHAHHTSESPMMQGRDTPADGVVGGTGLVDGRPVACIAYDFTVMAGTIGHNTEMKCHRIRELALERRMPMIWLLDSAGARVQEATTAMFAGSGQMFYDQVMMSGVIPQVAAMMGPCFAGTAYVPGLADFVPMVKKTSAMALAGPPLVKAATGADVTPDELGGPKLHCRESGVGDLEVDDDQDMIAQVKTWLSFFPSSFDDELPCYSTTDTDQRRIEDATSLVPENTRAPMDMHGLIDRLRDQDGPLFELKPKFGQAIITTLIRMGGRPIGVIASNSKHLGGVLTNDPADKAAKFIETCDAFGIPLLFLQDVPGFMVGVKTEKEGIIRHGSKMLFAVSRATVPKITVVVRKGYGAGYYVMCGKGYQPDLIVAWPNAEISVMGPEGAVNIAFRKQIEGSSNPDETRAQLVESFRDLITPYVPAARTYIDDVIDPRDTRKVILAALSTARRRKKQLPPRRHAIMPV
ncbi:MAG: acyl-CoA carboxylase subunit beta [Deltaproteobacteria bacterium]|nr:acyl-CoA carboxylase subunit beta [Deltaproteobacteria bacterium]